MHFSKIISLSFLSIALLMQSSFGLAKGGFKTPKNFPISKAFTNPSKMFQRGQLYDFYENLAYDKKLYALWADNSQSEPYAFGTSALLRRGKLKCKNGETEIKFCDTQIALPVNTTMASANEYSFTINPTKPKNLVFTAALRTNTDPANPNANNYDSYRGVSTDGGKSFTAGLIDTAGPDFFYQDNHALFDRFGNCWLVEIAAPHPNHIPYNLNFSVSIDGGFNFKLIQSIPFNPSDAFFGWDYPQPAFGGDGAGGWALYVAVDYVHATGDITPNIFTIPVFGLNSYGSINQVQLNSLFDVFSTGIPLVTDTGKMYIVGGSTLSSTFSPTLLISAQLTGLSSLVDGIFQNPPIVIAQNNFGPPFGSSGTAINFQSQRGVLPINPRCLTLDPLTGRLYFFYADIQPGNSQDMVMLLKYSDDGGNTWSLPLKISDCDKNNRCLQSMARDPITGNLFFTWYDCRKDPASLEWPIFWRSN